MSPTEDPQNAVLGAHAETDSGSSSQITPVRRKSKRVQNHVRKLREDRLLSKAEFARKAGLSPLTVDRIERGKPCRMNTKRKIILALGLSIEEKDQVFDLEADSSDTALEEDASRTSH
ncbi:MAG: helix-turn-helix domain-containing protein [Deltaproteobacteria bacterium]|nr:helix-turn-helix domain-containing protein [Deltaproteobacteria bacterium]